MTGTDRQLLPEWLVENYTESSPLELQQQRYTQTTKEVRRAPCADAVAMRVGTHKVACSPV